MVAGFSSPSVVAGRGRRVLCRCMSLVNKTLHGASTAHNASKVASRKACPFSPGADMD